MDRVIVISTGGTISMVQDVNRGGAAPELSGEKMLSGLGIPRGLAKVEVIDLFRLPSAHLTLKDIWTIREKVVEYATRAGVTGVVVSMGTDVLEEVAYLLDITTPGETPVVVTGAMRTASSVGWDGGANLLAAIRTAIAKEVRGLGTLVVLNDEVHAARYVTKVHTQALETFRSPGWGPIGRLDGDEVIVGMRVEPQDVIDCQGLEPAVYLIKLAAGMDDGFLRYALEQGARGVVLEVFGGGRVPPWWMPTIRQAAADGVPVVAVSRCPAGRLYDSYRFEGSYRDLVEAGVLFAQDLNGPKARIRLMAALDAVRQLGVPVSDFFEQREG